MSIHKSPAFQFYPADWMDKKVLRMTYEAQGIYFRLICHMWKDSEDQCSIENDLNMIASLLKVSRKKIENIFHQIQWPGNEIFQQENGKLISARLRKEKQKQTVGYEKRSAAAGKRWEQSICNADAKQCSSSSSSTSSSFSSSISSSNIKEKDVKIIVLQTQDVVNDLNLVTGQNYKTTTRKNQELIHARLKEGFTVDDFRVVHRKKFQQWGQDPKMALYLRPVTLWGTKFESYLNEISPQERSEMQVLWEKTIARYGNESR